MHLLLIRHGETALNAARVLQPPDTPLSERGRAQAEALAARLTGMAPAALVASDLPRARQTAAAIARATGLPMPTDDDPLAVMLHERHFGDWRGRAYDDLPGDPLAMTAAPPNGESTTDFARRVDRAFTALCERAAGLDGALAVVTHGLVIREILSRHAQWPAGTAPDGHALRLRNTSVSIIDRAAPHAVLRADCIDHLDATLRAPSDRVMGAV